jgi:hypothetical protein
MSVKSWLNMAAPLNDRGIAIAAKLLSDAEKRIKRQGTPCVQTRDKSAPLLPGGHSGADR